MYLLIAYKPNSVEYSQGRRVIIYDSSFVSINRLTGNLLIKYWSDILFQSKSLDYGEDSYKVQIYKDGNLNWDEVENAGATWDGDDGTETSLLLK